MHWEEWETNRQEQRALQSLDLSLELGRPLVPRQCPQRQAEVGPNGSGERGAGADCDLVGRELELAHHQAYVRNRR